MFFENIYFFPVQLKHLKIMFMSVRNYDFFSLLLLISWLLKITHVSFSLVAYMFENLTETTTKKNNGLLLIGDKKKSDDLIWKK